MLKNIVKPEMKLSLMYDLNFERPNGGGFSFPCDERGNVCDLPDEAKANYEYCMSHPEEFEVFNELVVTKNEYLEAARGTCSCGQEVVLFDQYYGACQCPNCGRWYNLFGQELRPPEDWMIDPSDEEYW